MPFPYAHPSRPCLKRYALTCFWIVCSASLLSEERQSILRGVEDLKNCRIPPEKVCIPKGGAVQTFWNEAIAQNQNHDCKRQNSTVVTVGSYADLSDKVATGECQFAVALKATLHWSASNKYCGKVELIGKPFFNTGLSFVLPKGSPYLDELSRATLALRNHDSIPSPDQYISRQVESCQFQNRPLISLRKLRIFFILSFAVVFVIFLEMIFDPQSVPDEDFNGNFDVEDKLCRARSKEREKADFNSYPEVNASIEDNSISVSNNLDTKAA